MARWCSPAISWPTTCWRPPPPPASTSPTSPPSLAWSQRWWPSQGALRTPSSVHAAGRAHGCCKVHIHVCDFSATSCPSVLSPLFTVTDPLRGSLSRSTRSKNKRSASCSDATHASWTCLFYSRFSLLFTTKQELSNLLCNSDPADTEACYTKPKSSSDTPGYQCETVPRELCYPVLPRGTREAPNNCFPLCTATALTPAGSVCCKPAPACLVRLR